MYYCVVISYYLKVVPQWAQAQCLREVNETHNKILGACLWNALILSELTHLTWRDQLRNLEFLPRCMECRRGLAMRILSVCPSVCPSVRPSHA